MSVSKIDVIPPLRLFCLGFVSLVFTSLTDASAAAQENPTNEFSSTVKIVKLLWKANGSSAGSTLSRSIETALERSSQDTLSEALEPLTSQLQEVVEQSDVQDPRFAPALAGLALLGKASSSQLAEALRQLGKDNARLDDRELLFRVWLRTDSQAALAYFETTLSRPDTSPEWAAKIMRECLDQNSHASTQVIFANWSQLPDSVRVAAIEPLSSSASSMLALAEAVAAGKINKDLVNTNQLRKWTAAGNAQLTAKIESVWGKIRESDDAERQKLVADTIQLLNSKATGSASRGHQVFMRVCSQCHQLHGQGYEVGPNITGNGRGKLEQLVSNVLDPSLVIGEAFQAKTLLTTDGEVIAGLVAAENDQYLKIKVQGGKVLEFNKDEDIEQIKSSPKSLMPEGLESQLTKQELLDLFAYLCLLKPLDAEDNEFIPGTPNGFVVP